MSLDSVYSFHILLISRQKANTIHTLIIKDSHNTSLCLVCIISSLIITLSKFLFDLFSWYLNKCVDIFGPPVDWTLPVVITPCDNILMYYTEISFMSSCDIWRLDPGLWSSFPNKPRRTSFKYERGTCILPSRKQSVMSQFIQNGPCGEKCETPLVGKETKSVNCLYLYFSSFYSNMFRARF